MFLPHDRLSRIATKHDVIKANRKSTWANPCPNITIVVPFLHRVLRRWLLLGHPWVILGSSPPRQPRDMQKNTPTFHQKTAFRILRRKWLYVDSTWTLRDPDVRGRDPIWTLRGLYSTQGFLIDFGRKGLCTLWTRLFAYM